MSGIGLNLREILEDDGGVKLKVLGLLLDGPAHSAGVRQVLTKPKTEMQYACTRSSLCLSFVLLLLIVVDSWSCYISIYFFVNMLDMVLSQYYVGLGDSKL